MSTIGPDSPAGAVLEPQAGAAPVTPGTKEAVPSGYAPIAALQSEQSNTAKAREETANLRAHMELAGYRFGDDGVPVAPAQPAPVAQVPSRLRALAEQLGIEPDALQGAISETVAQQAPGYIDPLAAQSFEQVKRGMAVDDRTYPIYAKRFESEIEQRVNSLPAHVRAMARVHPQIVGDARNAAIVAHLGEITAKQAEWAANPGQQVGRFTEGAAPGSGPAVPVGLSPEGLALATAQGITNPKVLEAAAANKAARERSR